MAEVSNRTKRLVGEIAVALCLACIWGVSSPMVSTSTVKAGVLRQFVKADRDNLDAYRFLAEFYIKAGRHEEAAHALKQVVRLRPNDADAWMMLGDIQSACGHHEDAMAAYQQVANLHVDNAQAHFQLGDAYLKVGERDLALEEHEKLKPLDKQLASDLLDRINHPEKPQWP